MVMNIEEHEEVSIITVLKNTEDRIASKLADKFRMAVCRTQTGFKVGQINISFARAFEITKQQAGEVMDYIALGSCPEQEDGIEPIGATKEYIPAITGQTYRYLDLLRRRFRDMLKENNKVKLEVRSFGNDTQPFLNVVIVYDETDEMQVTRAIIMSENLPQKWADIEEFYVCL